MKNLLLTLCLLISSIAFAQKPILDSIQVFRPLSVYPEKSEKVEPLLVETLYSMDGFYGNLTRLSNKTGLNSFIVRFFYREERDGPQKTETIPFSRKKVKNTL